MKATLNGNFGSGDYGGGVACLLLVYYGVIKRPWGFSYIMTKKTIQHASADVGLIFTAFDLFGMASFHFQNRTPKVGDETAIVPKTCIFGVRMEF